jgi:L-asparaginase II
MFPRSSNKPMQVLGMLRAGLRLDGELLALAAGSHSGEEFHIEGVRKMLASVALEETALQNPTAYPFDARAHKAWIRARHRKSRVAMNCSGKHAAMLMTCVANDWPLDTYLEPEHPLQQSIETAIQDCAGEKVAAVAVDGCGAPLHAISLAGLARSFGRFASAAPDTLPGRIAQAFRAYPEYTSGTRRLSPALMRSVPGLVCKAGAEGVFAVGLPDGRGIGVKIDDGASRARSVVIAAVLERLGLDNDLLRAKRQRSIFGGEQAVGLVRPGPALAKDQ